MDDSKNYIKQIVLFWKYLEVNPIPPTAVCLFLALKELENRAGWPDSWFRVTNKFLRDMCGIKTRKTFIENKKSLLDKGLIQVKETQKQGQEEYRLVYFQQLESNEIIPSFKDKPSDKIEALINDGTISRSDLKQYVENHLSDFDTFNQSNNKESVTHPVQKMNDDESVTVTVPVQKMNGGVTHPVQKMNTSVSSPVQKMNTSVTEPVQNLNALLDIKQKHINKNKVNENKVNINVNDRDQLQRAYDEIVKFWNQHRGDMGAIKKITICTDRYRELRFLIDEYSLSDIFAAILKAEQSDFLNGRTKDWKANFDWIMNRKNFDKVLCGNYDNKRQNFNQQAGRPRKGQKIHDYIMAKGQAAWNREHGGQNDQGSSDTTIYPDISQLP